MAQCVVARLPSSKPANASRNAPLHTEAMRRTLPDAVASQSISAVSFFATSRIVGDPGTITVSTTRRSNDARDTELIAVPSTVATIPPEKLVVWHR
ncbi:hypothetical protein D3C72_1678440 [compost metagenome]